MLILPALPGIALRGGVRPDGDSLELHAKFYAYAPFLYPGQVAVGESVYVVHTKYLEYVRYSHA